MNPTVTYEAEGALGYVTLRRPAVLNAMNDALLRDLGLALGEARTDPARVIIVRGEGRAFCAGADLGETHVQRTEAVYRRTRLRLERAIARAVRRLGKPLVAQVHGAAIGGGCVLALLCDVRMAAAGTRFALPEAGVGTTASLGGMYMLARIVGLGRAFELLYAGRSIDAARAEAIGLVNAVGEPERLEQDVRAFALGVAAQFPGALSSTRAALLRGLEMDFLSAAGIETEAAMRAHLSGDF